MRVCVCPQLLCLVKVWKSHLFLREIKYKQNSYIISTVSVAKRKVVEQWMQIAL